MATHTGSEGTVHIGTNAIGELKSWSYTEGVTTIPTTTLNDAAETHKTGTTNWSGSSEAFWDIDDTAQAALTIGASVTLKFYPEGEVSTDKYKTGTATVESINASGASDDMVGVSFTFKGNGALADATVA
jgi:hypothetical protein